MSDAKVKVELDAAGRVQRVLNAAGRAAGVAAYLPEQHKQALAELCSPTGECESGVAAKVITILRAAGKENKATGLEELE